MSARFQPTAWVSILADILLTYCTVRRFSSQLSPRLRQVRLRLHSQPQAELDKVNGSNRLPTFEDMASFPYVAAIIPERLRWRPIAVSGGTPHASIADDT